MFSKYQMALTIPPSILEENANLTQEELGAKKNKLSEEYKIIRKRQDEIEAWFEIIYAEECLRKLNLKYGMLVSYKGIKGVISNIFIVDLDYNRKMHINIFLLKKDGTIGKTKKTIYNSQLKDVEVIAQEYPSNDNLPKNNP